MSKQVICDICGNVIDPQADIDNNGWTVTHETIAYPYGISRSKIDAVLDVCDKCWDDIKARVSEPDREETEDE